MSDLLIDEQNNIDDSYYCYQQSKQKIAKEVEVIVETQQPIINSVKDLLGELNYG